MKNFIEKVGKENLTEEEAYCAMLSLLEKGEEDREIDTFLIAMNNKGVVAEELTGFVRGMMAKAYLIEPNVGGVLVDTCGTGGDCSGTFNVSTGAALVISAAGVSVAKHGNCSVSSKSGSADVLRAWGYNIEMEPKYCEKMIEEVGFAFLFAQRFHPAVKNVAGARGRIGKRTFFNLLGPLCNPAGAKRQVIGVYDKKYCAMFCEVLKARGFEHILVVYGIDGLDEISNIGETFVSELKNGKIKSYSIFPEDFGMKRYELKNLLSSSAEESARDLRGIFSGKVHGAKRDIVILNAAAGFYVAGVVNSLKEGVRKAEEVLDSGAVLRKLEEVVLYSNRRYL